MLAILDVALRVVKEGGHELAMKYQLRFAGPVVPKLRTVCRPNTELGVRQEGWASYLVSLAFREYACHAYSSDQERADTAGHSDPGYLGFLRRRDYPSLREG